MSEFVSKRRHLAVAAIISIGALLLSGCAAAAATPPTEKPTVAAQPTESSSATASTPTSTPNAINLDDPSSWIIDFTSVGPLAVGGDISAIDQSMTAFTRATYDGCPSVISFTKPEFPTFVIPDRLGTGVVEQIVLQAGVSAAEYSPNSPRTSTGIGIGSTQEELTAAYPALTFIDDHNTPHYAVSDDNGNWINFSIYENLVNDIVVRASSVVAKEYCS
jgi:hypothetical protein